LLLSPFSFLFLLSLPPSFKHTHSHIHTHIYTQAVPISLLPPALSLAIEKGFLHMGQHTPTTDTDYFDKSVLNEEKVSLIEAERTERKRYVGGHKYTHTHIYTRRHERRERGM
jgi:hypothetical protein